MVSSIVNWGYEDNFKSVYFFFTKRFRAYKNVCKQTLANKTKNKRAKNNKSSGFLHAQASKRVKVTWFAFCAFCTREIFLQKEENK